MTRRIICPYCEGLFDLEDSEVSELVLERCTLASRFGRIWRLASEYVDCFKSSPGAGMAVKKRVRILGELARLWEKGEFEYDGRRYRVSREAIEQGLITTCNAGKWNFRNHNYLKAVLMEKSERVSAEGMTAKEEAQGERRKANGLTEERRTFKEFMDKHPEISGLADKALKEMPGEEEDGEEEECNDC